MKTKTAGIEMDGEQVRIFAHTIVGKFVWLLALVLLLPWAAAAQTVTISGPSRVVGTTDTPKKLGKAESYAWFELGGTLNGGSTVTVSATSGVLTLDGTAGLSFSAGDGTNDSTMSFSGALTNVNAALDGMVLTPNAGFSGELTVTVSISGSQTASRSAPVTISRRLDLTAAQTNILNGVTTLHTNLTVSGEGMLIYGPNAGGLFYLGTDKLITCGVATWGSGRMVGLPNDNAANLDWSQIANTGNTAVFLQNAVRWASQTTGTSAVIVSGNSATATWLQGRGFTASYASDWWNNLSGKNLVILYSRDVDDPSAEASRIAALNTFVKAGGGVIVMGDAWTYWTRPKVNQAFFPAGLGWQHGAAAADYVAADRCATNTSVANIADYKSSYTTTQTDQAIANLSEFNRSNIAKDYTLGDEYYWMAVRALLQSAGTIPSPTPDAPLTADRTMDIALLNVEANYLHTLAATNLNFPYRWAFPVAAGAPRTNVVRTFNLPLTSSSRWVQTGLYLAPSEVATVTAPAGMVNVGIKVYVGHQTVESGGDLVLPPQVSFSYDLTNAQTSIANPHGGVIMLNIPGNLSFSGAQVTFSGVVEMPFFKLGETTDAAWVGGIRNRGTPFAVLESPAISLIVRADTNSPVRGYNDLEAGLTHLNGIMTNINNFYSWNPINRYDAWEIAYANGGVSYWPFQLAWNGSVFSLRAICAGVTGLNLHEAGHSFDPGAIMFQGFSETTPNLSAPYLAQLGYVERWKRFNEDVFSHVDAYSRAQADVALWTAEAHHDVGAKEVHVRGYGDQFGMTEVKDIIADVIAANPSTDAAQLDEWLYQFSTHAGFNVSPWFACWRLYPTASGSNRVSALPKWNLIERGPEDMIVEQNTSVTFLDPSLNDFSYDGVLNLVSVGNPLHGTVVNNGNGTYTYTPTPGYTGKDKIVYTVSNGLGNQFPTDIPITVLASASYPALVSGQVGVGSSSWTTVTLDRSYSNMVVVAQPVYLAGMPPVVTRIQNAASNSFSVKVQRVDGQSVPLDGVLVEYMVVEAGVYTMAQHGIKMEAGKFTSSITDRKGSFVGQKIPMGNDLYAGYVLPVIYGQVMTDNDPRWSVFWAGEWANQMTMGKHVGEDPVQTRADETIGYIVFEAERVTAQIGNLRFRLLYARYSDIGYFSSSTSTFQYDQMMPQLTSVMAGANCDFDQNGAVAQTFDGFWPVLVGPGLLQSNVVSARLVEDQLADMEMDESGSFDGGYMLFSSTVNTPPYVKAAFPNQIMAMNGPARVLALSAYFGDMTPNGLTYSVVANSNPSLVQASVTGTNLTLSVQTNQTGVAYITLAATDGSGTSVQKTIAVWVMANTAPVAVADSANTPTNTPVIVNVVANDVDAESPNSLTVSNVTNPAHGVAVNNGNGTVTYTPANGWSGNDSFTYTVRDDLGLTAVGTVAVRVGGLGAKMVIYYNFEETAGNVIHDRSGAPVQTDASVIGQTMDLASTPGILGKAYNSKLGNYAAIDPIPNGVFDGAIADAMKFGDNATGTDFTIAGWFKFMDNNANEFGNFDWGSGNTREESAGFAIRRDYSRYYAVGGGYYGQGFDYTDLPTNTWKHIAFSGDRQGDLTMYINGVKVGTATGWGTETGNSYEDHMPFMFGAHWQGGIVDANTVNDDFAVWHRALSTSEILNLYTNGVGASPKSIADLAGIVTNTPTPPVALDDNRFTGEGEVITIDVLGNDTDPNIGDLLSLQSVTQSANGQVATNANGTVTYTPNPGFYGVDSFAYTVRDPGGLTDVGTVNVLVTHVGSITHTLSYLAGANGAITGSSPQTVNHGANGSAVTAVANTGYHFANWSDGSMANPRTDSNVTNDITVTAGFAINTYTLTYTAGANGTLTGSTPQTVNYGTSGTAITANASTGYHFVNWTDGSTANPRTDVNVTSNLTVTANFAINTYTLTYTAGANGTISGTTPQTVNYGANGTAITAVPDSGYAFTNWSDSSTANPRTDVNVTGDISVTANFIPTVSGPTFWSGGGSDGNWSTPANWSGPVPTNGQALAFQGVLGLRNTNNLLTAVGQITFTNGNFTLSGNALSLAGGILNLAGINTNAIPTTLAQAQSFISSNGTLAVSGTLANGGYDLMLDGAGSHVLSGVLSGAGGLVKNGTGVATLSGANTYSGGTLLNAGTLSGTAGVFGAGEVRLNASGSTLTITSGTLMNTVNAAAGVVGTLNLTSGLTFGGVFAGSGTITVASTSYTQTRTFSAGGNGGYAGALVAQRGNYNFTAANADYHGTDFQIVPSNTGDTVTYLTFNGAGTTVIGTVSAISGGNLQVGPGTMLDIKNGILTRGTTSAQNAIINPSGGSGGTLTSSGGVLTFGGASGTTVINAGVMLVDYSVGTPLSVVKTGAQTLTLNNINTYSGTTTVSAGTLLVNGSTAAGSVTVASGATLGGTGVIGAATAIQPGGTLLLGSGSIETLTINNTLTLQGTVLAEINKTAGTADKVQGVSTLTFGGTLTVANLAGTLAAGDSFTLFSATSYTGSFTTINLPSLGVGLQWNTSQLAVNGTISVVPTTCTLTYTAGANGTLTGSTPQTVNYGTSGTAITANANTGYHFVNWTDGSTANPRTDVNVTNNLTVTANFAINTYTLTYAAGANGSITGSSPQTVNYGGSGSPVTAVPNAGYAFTNWSDGLTANPRTDANITSNISVTASFVALAPSLPPPWTTNKIGTITAVVNATSSGGTFAVTGGGANISGKNDNLWFVNQPATGDGSIIARVVSLQNTGSGARAGVMMRESTATGSRSVFVGLTPTSTAQWVRRSTTGGNSSTTTASGLATPYWVRLVRSGNTFTGYVSPNGINWSQVASADISMNSSYSLGLAVCSGSSSTTNLSVFDNVVVNGPGTGFAPGALTPPPAQISAFNLSTELVNFQVTGETNSVWLLQESLDGRTWTPVQTIGLINGTVQHSEADASPAMRLFRLVWSP